MHNRNWDNLRFVLTVADSGSVNSAARALGVNHATVLRRIAAFEADHGGPVFEKTAAGYRVLPGRANVIQGAREVESAVLSVERLMQGARAPLRGVVRLSSTDSFCQELLPAFASELQITAPQLQIELMSSNAHLDFARMQADITVRPALSLPDEMTGEVAAHLTFRAFSAPGAMARGADGHWLGLTGPLARALPGRWMADHVLPENVVAGSDSFLVLQRLARAGLGATALPAFLGMADPVLVPRADLMPDLQVPVWVASFAELCDVPRIRVTTARLLAFLDRHAGLLAGEAGLLAGEAGLR